MAKPAYIELGRGKATERIPILFEDRSVLAIDKPAGWMLVPTTWVKTGRNLQAAIQSSIGAGDFWARSRNLRFLRYVHRLDADTSGVMLFGKSPGAVESYGDLFASRQMEKTYLAVVSGMPKQREWVCQLKLGDAADDEHRVKVEARDGKETETRFRVVLTRQHAVAGDLALVEARPLTGRKHQIRVHLAEAGHPVVNDELYGRKTLAGTSDEFSLGLRAVGLAYVDPFQKRRINIQAAADGFARFFGFRLEQLSATEAESLRH